MQKVNSKKWKVAKKASKAFFDSFKDYNPITAQLFYNRGIESPDAAERFISPSYIRDSHDPYLMADMDKAVERILRAIKKKEKIMIHGDYDADGVVSTVLLYEVLKKFTPNVDYYLPSRQQEGYGLSLETIKKFREKNIDLIITVDCGVTNVKEVDLANKFGIDVVVTDHHSIPAKLPDAYAILNPARKDDKYPYKKLAGVGVAFKLAKALLEKLGEKELERKYLDLVAVGTIADCTPVNGENRVLVKHGLDILGETKRTGLIQLMKKAGVDFDNIDTFDLGFKIGPRLNAAGRLKHSSLAFELLTTASEERACELSHDLDAVNKERQSLTYKIIDEAEEQIGNVDEKRMIVAYGENWPVGVVGLVAGKLCERYARPALVLEKGKDQSVGSARSIPNFNIVEAIRSCSDLVIKHGGHSQAAGVTLKNKHLDNFCKRINDFADNNLKREDLVSEISVEAVLPQQCLSWDFFNEIDRFKPFGLMNEKPKFIMHNLEISEVRAVGADGKHLKARLKPRDFSTSLDAIGFNLGSMIEKLQFKDEVSAVFELDLNTWNGNTNLQLKLVDLKRTNA